jgi:ribosomal protein L24E
MKVICKYCGKDIKEVEGCNERIYVSKNGKRLLNPMLTEN